MAGLSHRASPRSLPPFPPFRPGRPSAPDHVCGNNLIPLLPRRTSSVSPPEPRPGGTRRSRAHAQVTLPPPMAGCAGDDAREPTPLPVQSPVRDGRLGLCGACVTHCRAEPENGQSTFCSLLRRRDADWISSQVCRVRDSSLLPMGDRYVAAMHGTWLTIFHRKHLHWVAQGRDRRHCGVHDVLYVDTRL